MNTKGVEDGIVCEFCGTHCYQGAEHNARVEDNARFDDPKPAAVPVEERTLRKTCYCNEIWCPTCYPPVPTAKPIPEERTAEMEQLISLLRECEEYVGSCINGCGCLADRIEGEIDRLMRYSECKSIPPDSFSPEMDELMGELRDLAMKATPGMRQARRRAYDWAVDSVFGLVCNVSGSKKQNNMEGDAEFIAAASPESILKLLDHIEGSAK